MTKDEAEYLYYHIRGEVKPFPVPLPFDYDLLQGRDSWSVDTYAEYDGCYTHGFSFFSFKPPENETNRDNKTTGGNEQDQPTAAMDIDSHRY